MLYVDLIIEELFRAYVLRLWEIGNLIHIWFLAVLRAEKLLPSSARALQQFLACEIKLVHTGRFYSNCTTVKGDFEPRAVFVNLGMFIFLRNHALHSEHLHNESFCSYIHTGERNNLEVVSLKQI